MTRVLILPGFRGSGPGHWQQHWLSDHPGARLVEQDNWDRPDLDAWLDRLETVLRREGDVTIVAHSLGCLLAAHLADRPSAGRVRGALLVAPCELDRTDRIHPGVLRFGSMPEKRLPFPSLVVASLNDPYMPLSECRHYASLWGSDVIDLGYAGHINVASGFGRWPQGYRLASLLRGDDSRRVLEPASGIRSDRPFRGLVRERRLLS